MKVARYADARRKDVRSGMKVIRTPMLRKTAAKRLPDATARSEEKLRARGYKPATAESVDDLALLPGEMRLFRAETRQAFEILAQQLLPKLDTIIAEQKVDREDINMLKRDVTELRRADLETKRELAAIKQHLFKRKPRRKK